MFDKFFELISNKRTQDVTTILSIIGGLAAIGYFIEKRDIIKRITIGLFDIISDLIQDPVIIAISIFVILLAITAYLLRGTDKMTDNIKFEEPEGQIPLDSPFYMERPPIESDCYETITRHGSLIRIKAPRQMGKTSLMTRVLHHAGEQGGCAIHIDLQEADREIIANLDLFLQWFCASVAQGMEIDDKIEEYWKGILGSKSKASNYFQKYLLSEADIPLVLGMDEVDRIFEYPEIAMDFFALLRAWHEKGKNDDIWKRFRLVMAHSKEVYIPLDINQSPFNVGLAIELPELTQEQALELAKRHDLKWSDQEIDRIMAMVGGHPYLLRVALHTIARHRMTLDELLKIAPTEQGPYTDHLRRHLSNLRNDDKLITAVGQVIKAKNPVKIGDVETFKLRSMGLVKFKGEKNNVIPLCDLYKDYFRDRL